MKVQGGQLVGALGSKAVVGIQTGGSVSLIGVADLCAIQLCFGQFSGGSYRADTDASVSAEVYVCRPLILFSGSPEVFSLSRDPPPQGLTSHLSVLHLNPPLRAHA